MFCFFFFFFCFVGGFGLLVSHLPFKISLWEKSFDEFSGRALFTFEKLFPSSETQKNVNKSLHRFSILLKGSRTGRTSRK